MTMDRQETLLPPEGNSVALLNECLSVAFAAEGNVLAPGTGQRHACQIDHMPLQGFSPRVQVTKPAATIERRSDSRGKMSLYRTATLRWNGKQMLCVVRNLSATGMMCRSLARPATGERIEIEMRSGDCVAGTVVWSRDAETGIRFDAPIDVATMLNGRVHNPDAPVQRMPRLTAGCEATLIAGSVRQSVTLLDLSQGGAKIESTGLRQGEQVKLGLPGLEARSGVVRWVNGSHAGIAFLSPIPFDQLENWALERPIP